MACLTQQDAPNKAKEIERAYMAATLIDGVLGFSKNLSIASYAGFPVCFTA